LTETVPGSSRTRAVNGEPFHFRHYHILPDSGTGNVRAGFAGFCSAGVSPALLEFYAIREIAGGTPALQDKMPVFKHTLAA
jgi:hypothetical protein